MTRKRSSATERALERYRKGESGLAAAKAEGIHPTTLYRDPEYKRLRSERKESKDEKEREV